MAGRRQSQSRSHSANLLHGQSAIDDDDPAGVQPAASEHGKTAARALAWGAPMRSCWVFVSYKYKKTFILKLQKGMTANSRQPREAGVHNLRASHLLEAALLLKPGDVTQ